MFGWVRRERLDESERFWRELYEQAGRQRQRALDLYIEMTDKYVAAAVELQELKKKLKEMEDAR